MNMGDEVAHKYGTNAKHNADGGDAEKTDIAAEEIHEEFHLCALEFEGVS